MKSIFVVALSVLSVSLASAQSVPLQDPSATVIGTPVIKAQNRQSIDLVNTAVDVTGSVASVGAECEMANTLTLRGNNQPFICSRTKHWIPVAAAQMPPGAAYEISVPAAPAFMPSKVYDDGKFTFIQLQRPYRGVLPVVFAVAADGSREVLNFKWDEQNARLIVTKLIDRVMRQNKVV